MEFNCCNPYASFNERKDMSFLLCCLFLTLLSWALVSLLVIKPQRVNQEIDEKVLKLRNLMAMHKFKLDMTASEFFNESVTNLPIDEGFVNVQGCHVFYRRVSVPSGAPPKQLSILFLHGHRFTSQNWQNIHTLSLMAANGYSSVAIDLPNHGQTTGKLEGDKAEFISKVMKELKIVKPVLVSPSMSGQFSIAILKNSPQLISGLVAIAPVEISLISKQEYKKIQVPTLIVYGSKDNTGLAEISKEQLKHLPNHFDLPIMNAGHAAYLDQPKIFHRALYSFLSVLTS